jgi:hypothetical protein
MVSGSTSHSSSFKGVTMIDSIQGSMMVNGSSQFANHALTDEQKQKVQDILSKFDPNNLTAADAKQIFKAFRDAGIQPGDDLKNAITDAGFDPNKLRSLSRPEGHKHHHSSEGSQASNTNINVNTLQSLQSILGQYDLTNLSTSQKTEISNQLNQAGLLNNGNMIDLSA